MIDSHAHIHYFENYKEIIEKSKIAGVNYILNIFELAEENGMVHYDDFIKQKDIFIALGVHPNSVSKISIEKTKEIMENNMKYLSAIGESGIDLYYSDNKLQQLEYLNLHLYLCEKYNKTIIIHSRNCKVEDIINEIKKYNNINFVFHSFNFPATEVIKVIDSGGYVSFSGMITFNKCEYLLEAAKICPINRILVETDTPFLAPVPKRGKKNEPAFIKYTYDAIAKCKNITVEELIIHVNKNFFKCFNIVL